MKHHLIQLDSVDIPDSLRPYWEGATIYDSSCSQAAKVYFLDKGQGFYLKTAKKGALEKEASLTSFFHGIHMAPEVVAYESLNVDWLLTLRSAGDDCIAPQYTQEPLKLCDTTASILRMLHETSPSRCPCPNKTKDYLLAAQQNYIAGTYDTQFFPDNWGFTSAEEAWHVVEKTGAYLQTDTLLHGDYCLPNIILNNWQFSSFIDLGAAGVGDRHIDLFWGIWSLQYNLKTDRYRNRFLDVYGRDKVNPDCFRTVAAIEVFG